MDEESGSTSMYYCHMCSLIIRPVPSVEEMKCPHCHTGFVEEMDAGSGNAASNNRGRAATEREVSLWAPVLMDFLATASSSGGSSHHHHGPDGGGDLAAFARRQHRNIALMQLLSALQEADDDARRERVVLVSPADARAVLAQERAAAAGALTLGDLFLGPGMDVLLEYMAETDPSRQGTPPATKEAVAALPTVRVPEATTCPVCLDELAAGAEAREMPCKHVFHDQCIVPWLDMHSSCPVCRYQLPTTEEPTGSSAAGSEPSGAAARGDRGRGGDAGNGGRRHWFSWPFGRLFSQRSNGSSSSSS